MRNEKNSPAERRRLAFLALECTREIAELNGAYAPKKIDATVEHVHLMALNALVANVDLEMAEHLLEEAKEEARLAEMARALLVEGHTVDAPDTRVSMEAASPAL
jgi:hypothetical protein